MRRLAELFSRGGQEPNPANLSPLPSSTSAVLRRELCETVDCTGRGCLHLAAAGGHVECIHALFDLLRIATAGTATAAATTMTATATSSIATLTVL